MSNSVDPYIHTDVCVARLYKEYQQHGKLVIATDYDDTVYDYHKKGYQYTQVINLLKRCDKLNFYICVFTGSPLDKYDSILAYMKGLDIRVATINKNPFPLPFGNDGKMYFNILLDDRAGLGQSCLTLERTLNLIEQKTK